MSPPVVLQPIRTGLLGTLFAAALGFAFETALLLWAGSPCNGTRIYKLQLIVTGWGCVDHFGPEPILFVASTLLCALGSTLGAFVGPYRSAIRGALGTTIGLFLFDIYMNRIPGEPFSMRWVSVIAVGSLIGGAIGYGSAWLATRYVPMKGSIRARIEPFIGT